MGLPPMSDCPSNQPRPVDDDEDPLSPPEPREACFDAATDTWVLGKYTDVLAALRETRLSPAGPRKKESSKTPAQAAQKRMRVEVQAAFSTSKLTEWHAILEPLAYYLTGQLANNGPVDVVREFAEPWCLAAAGVVTGADSKACQRLRPLAAKVSASAAEPQDDELQLQASLANKELERNFETSTIPMAAPTFVALSRTLVCLLANGWLALLRQPDRMAELRAHPDLMPRAIEELLRFACLPQTIFRRASANLELNDFRIASGERVTLMLASANRDPAQFVNPELLDFARRGAGHLSLGLGPHSCVGASLIRMTAAAATRAFVHRFSESELHGAVEWRGGSGFRSPASLYVTKPR